MADQDPPNDGAEAYRRLDDAGRRLDRAMTAQALASTLLALALLANVLIDVLLP